MYMFLDYNLSWFLISWVRFFSLHFYIQDFKRETGFNFSLYCDPEREIYSELNLEEGYEPTDLSSK